MNYQDLVKQIDSAVEERTNLQARKLLASIGDHVDYLRMELVREEQDRIAAEKANKNDGPESLKELLQF